MLQGRVEYRSTCVPGDVEMVTQTGLDWLYMKYLLEFGLEG